MNADPYRWYSARMVRARFFDALWPTLAAGVLGGVTIVSLRLEGRRWWCAKRDLSPWVTNVWPSHCSHHLFDPYSLTHISHGLIFYFFFRLFTPRLALAWRLVLSLALASGW